ncbi:dihydrofolate reductase family protein [Leucobacter sp. cx-42]|uniref:dihydrofolate reductase family protein n=1 Tax=unclassified Leucobacter TaxID=2621730 RepID=UPI00165D628F|nr:MULTISPECIES: dihydrofolate reductase family protein [unclassified Leucobacter]MBC9954474.1 dihydrofolate reductase family protein [Leucobacter sp. cx-42]
MTTRTWHGRAFLGMSLDGFIAGPDGDLSFLESAPGAGQHVTVESAHPAFTWETFFPTIDTLVLGRTTYEKVLTFGDWPYATLRVFVLSTTLTTADERVTVVRSLAELHQALDAAGAREVYIDGGRTVQACLALGLIDELTVSILPMVIGGGSRLFGDGDQAELAVRGTHVAADGLVRITYRVLRSSHA